MECQASFPLALCPGIAAELEAQLAREAQQKKQLLLSTALGSLEEELLELIDDSELIKGEKKRRLLAERFKETISKQKCIDDSIVELHGLSDSESHQIVNIIKSAQSDSVGKVLQSTKNLERFHRKLQAVLNSIDQAPDDLLLKDNYSELSTYNVMLGETKSDFEKVEELIDKCELELAKLERDRRKLEDRQKENKGISSRIALIDTVNKAMEVYHNRLTDMKIEHLRHEIVQSFNRIARKSEFVKDVQIDKKTFEVTVFDSKGEPISKEDLSSGEKQIFAISFLWALARTSGRPLPIIVDTPLGRLDSEHRLNLVENYFPKASHQVILFSTDTEVDEKLYAVLEPYISHCYHLRFSKENFETVPEEEYFWNKEIAHA